jgi:phage portal protein BeeE
MKIFGREIFKRNNQPIQEYPREDSATSLIFGGYKLADSPTALSAFYAAMSLISNSVAQLPIQVKRDNEIDRNHPINLIFKDALISKFILIKQMVTDVILYGNAYAYIERATDGTPVSLTYCENGSVTVRYNQRNQDLY